MLLKTDELPEDTTKENEDTTVKPSTDVSEPDLDDEGTKEGEEDKKDEDEETMEYTDENGRRVRRVVTKTVTTTSTKTTSDNGDEGKNLTREILQMEGGQGGVGENENVEVREFVDENGRRVRRIVKKTIITTTKRTTSNNDGPTSVATETKEVSSGGHDSHRVLINFGGGVPRPSEEQVKLQPDSHPSRAIQEKDVFLKFGSKPPTKEESKIKVDINGQPFPNHDIKFGTRGHTTITTESSGDDNLGNSTSYHRSVITKTIGGGGGTTVVERSTKTSGGETTVVEHSTKNSGHDGEHPITVVKKNYQIDVPEWMEEKSSPETKRRSHETSDISVHLKYPRAYTPKIEPEPVANESKIHPEVAKRDKPVIGILNLDDVVKEKEKEEAKKTEKKEEKPTMPEPPAAEEDEEEDESEEEDEGEVDEFEEEIVVMEVRRKPRYHKGLEIPQAEPEKVGIPVEDLLEVPTIENLQESAPDEFIIQEEKIEPVQRPPVNESTVFQFYD